jgi:hypothetical protein
VLYAANPSTPDVRAAQASGELARIETPTQQNRPFPGVWCADNGCGPGAGGGPGKGWPGYDRWFRWLRSRRADAASCLFAVAPDVVGDAVATLARSLPWLPRIRWLGYRVAFVVQDGAEAPGMVPWDMFDALFIGGSTEWKLGPAARALVADAKARGKWVHMGRVNSARRYRYAEAIGCDSADGTFILFAPDLNLARFRTWDQGPPLFNLA